MNVRQVLNFIGLMWIAFFLTVQVSATNYYVDNIKGKDRYSGTSQKKAWKTLKKVNAKIFQPGDTIFFKSGGVWVGQLHPKGSGKESKPIVIDKYGGESKPLID